MKNLYLLTVAACFIGSATYAQETTSDNRELLKLGFKVGTNYSNIYDSQDEEFDANPKFGLAIGAFLAVPLHKFIGVQAEILFSQKGFIADGNFLGADYTLTRTSNFIDLPLLFSLKPVKNLAIVAGPQYSFLISQKDKFENSSLTIEDEEEFDNDNLRKNTLCFTGGLDFIHNHLVLSGRVGWDLFNNHGDGTSSTPRYKNAWYQLTVGYQF